MYVSIKIFYKIFLWYIFMKNKHSYLLEINIIISLELISFDLILLLVLKKTNLSNSNNKFWFRL